MPISRVAAGISVAAATMFVACSGEEPVASGPDAAPDRPAISVTVPPQRLTPFCQAMIELTDQLRGGDVENSQELIVETYRRIAPDAPNAIVDDFAVVLAALEAGEPPPTDPPRDTVATTPPVSSTSVPATEPPSSTPEPSDTTGSVPTTAPAAGAIDEGFAPGDSPSERINSYVTFECRASANNPGPAPTQPSGAPDDTVG